MNESPMQPEGGKKEEISGGDHRRITLANAPGGDFGERFAKWWNAGAKKAQDGEANKGT